VVAESAAAATFVAGAAAETWHLQRCRRLAGLAFGPKRRPALWARLAPAARVASLAAVVWGMTTLALLVPKVHLTEGVAEGDLRHLVIVLDVSPSMRLTDAGPEGKQTRMQRSAALMESFFERVAVSQYLVSVVACYNGAKPVVVDTRDGEVVRNILNDLPMQYAFRSGKTDLFAGLEEAARIAHPWPPKSGTLIVLSDGDTVPATRMPKLPDSIGGVLVIGVGDTRSGKFIDGRQSRQEASMLRQIATRLAGTYHNGNVLHVPTETLTALSKVRGRDRLARLTRREYALIAIATGSAVLALLPLALHWFGTAWQPGVPVAAAAPAGAGRAA
jgi:Ca-activated chloride channel family protein